MQQMLRRQVGGIGLAGSPPFAEQATTIRRQAGSVAARRQLNDLPDDLWTKISIEFYRDAADAAFKALED